jgi:hypothetical protein
METILLGIIIFLLILLYLNKRNDIEHFNDNDNELFDAVADINFKPEIHFKRKHELYSGVNMDVKELNNNVYFQENKMNIKGLVIENK